MDHEKCSKSLKTCIGSEKCFGFAQLLMGIYGFLIEKLNAYNLAYLHFVEGATVKSCEIPEGVMISKLLISKPP